MINKNVKETDKLVNATSEQTVDDSTDNINADAAKLIKDSKVFLEYYKDNIDMLNTQLTELANLSKQLNDRIVNMTERSEKTTLASAQLVESLVSLKSLQLTCNNQLFAIKKAIIDYTIKTRPKNSNDSFQETLKEMRTLVRSTDIKPNKISNQQDEIDLDAIIEKQIADN